VGLFHESGFWYVYAWCHLRNDYRQFRTDRLHAIARTEEAFTRGHGNLGDHRRSKVECTGTTKVRIMVSKEIARYIQSGRKYYGFQSEIDHGDRIEMCFETLDLENAFPRWYMMFADHAEILEPGILKDRVKEIIGSIDLA
jgi:predicted DNA-binding transcriptional regulator YafY